MSQEERRTTLIEPLPIDAVLAETASALEVAGVAILRAPPGAGKTTRLPLHLLHASWLNGLRIVMLEPRRLAARAAAARMAHTLHEDIGATVGYRMHMDSRVSNATRIEVVTEGVLTRMLQTDPSLDGVGLVIFDEFHERSIHADVGLALAMHARALLRPDLRVLIMSATLNTAAVAAVLDDPPVITTEGRSWPVQTHFLDRPLDGFVDSATARTTLKALRDTEGDILVFLPGAAEIRRVESDLRASVPADVDVYPLFGQLAQGIQDRALAPSPRGRRKIVLATSIAQTSLTIEGVRVVVDSGLMRVPRFSVRTGMTRLETIRVTRATAEQRQGRAGRTAPGVCYRMWTAPEDAGLVPFDTPEILETDLVPLALELAAWGVRDTAELAWIDPPPAAGLKRARVLLRNLHAIDDTDHITPHGRMIAGLGQHPRLAHMILTAAPLGLLNAACDVAALLAERDFFRSDIRDPDMRLRIDALRTGDHRADHTAIERVRKESAQLRARVRSVMRQMHAGDTAREIASNEASAYTGLLLAFAYPDRIAQKRHGSTRFLMANGRGAVCDVMTALSSSDLISVAALDDSGRDARVQLAAPLERADLETHFADDIVKREVIEWDEATNAAHAFRVRELGALVLDRVRITASDAALQSAMLVAAIERNGLDVLPWSDDTRAFRRRVMFARAHAPDRWPDLSDAALLHTIHEWLMPFANDARKLSEITPTILRSALQSFLTFDQHRELDMFAPSHFVAPTGSHVDIDYSDPVAPFVAVRLQELFGLADSPRIAGGTVALTLHLLSPARRPVQVTRDLAGFWKGSYFDVRKDLRGRYPRHEWPLDPLAATPTRRAKPRGT